MRLIKKVLAVALVLTMVFTLVPATALASDAITVTIDGQRVTFADQQPVIINNRTLVPVGGVFEALGFTPSWSGSAQTATLTRVDYTVVITIGSATFTTNGVEYTLDVPAQIINNRTMLSLRAVLESIGIAPDNIGWDGNARAITIITDVEVTPPVDPVDAEAELAAFLSGMDMSAIRDALGVNFTVGMTEYAWGTDGIHSHRVVYPSGTVSTNNLEINNVLALGTQTGDVILHRMYDAGNVNIPRRYSLRIDIGNAIEVFNAPGGPHPWFASQNIDLSILTENCRAFHTTFFDLYLTADVDAVLAAFIDGMDMDAIREALGADFTVGMMEYVIDLDRNAVQSYRFLHVDGELDVNFSATGQLGWTNMFNTQTGDVTLHRLVVEYATTPVARYLVRVDLGAAKDLWIAYPELFPYHVPDDDWITERHRVHHFILVADLHVD